jgi:hypothetical protein
MESREECTGREYGRHLTALRIRISIPFGRWSHVQDTILPFAFAFACPQLLQPSTWELLDFFLTQHSSQQRAKIFRTVCLHRHATPHSLHGPQHTATMSNQRVTRAALARLLAPPSGKLPSPSIKRSVALLLRLVDASRRELQNTRNHISHFLPTAILQQPSILGDLCRVAALYCILFCNLPFSLLCPLV